ncbi:hypothetical protein QO010_001967 [Caulobacter ginsengisoli]|uniref:DUF2157 domain-containing protein n=1 Tax=Caulobacter ginsengisoli TaxID=400775 RepID=A0ABU0IQ99_9CAUL|nr:DUF2157 domain-containing protein [Caulobacter ginsengisoli]MDQ0464186.1 hypothetical protein [Caulobacter ginsengisoli]
MANYKDRLRGDLDRWIGEGLVPQASRQPMLDSVADTRRPDAVSALAMVGVLLAGAAIIAFVAANWNGIPRIARYSLLIAAFLAACLGGAWADRGGRPNLRNSLLTLAAAIYAATIGLTGQIFDIAGDPKTALMGAGLAAALLAVVGRSSGAAVAAMVLIGLGDLASPETWWLLPTAIGGTVLAVLWRSRPTAHMASIGLLAGTAVALIHLNTDHGIPSWQFFGVSGLMALGALAGRFAGERGHEGGRAFYGWLAWGALAYFAAASAHWHDQTALLIAHRIAWLLLSGLVLTLGRVDRHGGVMAAGVLSLIGAIMLLMMDLGVDLLTASLIFAVAAIAILAAVWLMRGREPR